MTATTTTPVRRRDENMLVTVMFFAAGIVFLDRFGITYWNVSSFVDGETELFLV